MKQITHSQLCFQPVLGHKLWFGLGKLKWIYNMTPTGRFFVAFPYSARFDIHAWVPLSVKIKPYWITRLNTEELAKTLIIGQAGHELITGVQNLLVLFVAYLSYKIVLRLQQKSIKWGSFMLFFLKRLT